MPERPADRFFGLDVVRAVAIICVLVTHAALFIRTPGLAKYGVLPVFGLIGVELFFGLSGYLIGGMLLSRRHNLRTFYLHRLAKILPPYWLVVALVFIAAPGYGWWAATTHLLFIQDFYPVQADIFPVSWSLAVEFWFYMVVPLVFIGLQRSGRHTLLIRLILLVMITLVVRLALGFTLHPTWEFGIHRFIPVRLDALIFGVLAAIIEAQYHAAHRVMTHWFTALAGLGLLVSVAVWFGEMFFHYAIFEASDIAKAVVLTLAGLAVMLVVLAAKHHVPRPGGLTGRVVAPVIGWLSRISYSLYLIHLFIYGYFATLPGPRPLLLAAAVASSLLLATLMYELFEVRMVLRGRRSLERRWSQGRGRA